MIDAMRALKMQALDGMHALSQHQQQLTAWLCGPVPAVP